MKCHRCNAVLYQFYDVINVRTIPHTWNNRRGFRVLQTNAPGAGLV